MKTTPSRISGLGLIITLGTFAPAVAVAAAADPSPEKDHVLFVGADFVVEHKGQLLPVVGAGSRTVIIQVGESRTELPLRTVKDIRMTRGLKLTNLTATLDHIKAVMSSDAADAEAADQAMTGMALQMYASVTRDRAYGATIQADISRSAYSSDPAKGPISPSLGETEKIQVKTWQNAVQVEQQFTQGSSALKDWTIRSGSVQTNTSDEIEITPELSNRSAGLVVASITPPSASGNGTVSAPGATASTQTGGEQTVHAPATTIRVRDAGAGNSDRFDLEFAISAPHPLENAYVVVVTEYSAPGHPGDIFRRVLSTSVGTVDVKPKKVSLYQVAFPPGFTLRTFTVDVYANGQEIATNLSDTKVKFTRDEAYEYIFANYLASHQGKTVPPAAVLMAPRSELREVARRPDARVPLYVAVDENGKVVTITSDAEGNAKSPDAVAAVLTNFRFIPALDKGLPVAGRAKLVLADFGP